MPDKIVKGTPPMIMLPAKNYFFKVHEDRHKLTVPKTGLYKDLDDTFYTDESGAFKIFDPDTGHVDLASIGQVLFATKQYPDLKQGEFFVPFSLVVEENEVHILGQVIELVTPINEDSEEKTEEGNDG